MVEASVWIFTFVYRLNDGDVFTTRDVLGFGSRAAVDNALKRFVARGLITRLARGVFMRSFGTTRKISIEEIARVKAAAFKKSVAQTDAAAEVCFDVASSQGLLLRKADVRGTKVAVGGRSSSFMVAGKRVHLRRSRKLEREK
jgi:hypothetical protein